MPSRLTVAVLMLDIETEWTLNASLTTSSSYRKCSKRRTLDHSAPATSRLQIEGTMRRSRPARGFDCGSGMASVAAPLRETDREKTMLKYYDDVKELRDVGVPVDRLQVGDSSVLHG